jgi:mannosyltransferase OCH1-like enzyme
LEYLWHHGGIYLDADVEVYRSLIPLLGCSVFAAWEDQNTVPDAVIGAERHHPAIEACLQLALARIESDDDDWHTGNGAWATGPGVTTAVLVNRPDVLLLPPGSFYPYHYSEKLRRWDDHESEQPWAFGAHHWAGSWL